MKMCNDLIDFTGFNLPTHYPHITSWQYCRMPSLVPMQLLVPEGSVSHFPLCTLMCMLSLPQNMATWGSAKRPMETSVGTCRESDKKEISVHIELLGHVRQVQFHLSRLKDKRLGCYVKKIR